jgi:hypothetical protein
MELECKGPNRWRLRSGRTSSKRYRIRGRQADREHSTVDSAPPLSIHGGTCGWAPKPSMLIRWALVIFAVFVHDLPSPESRCRSSRASASVRAVFDGERMMCGDQPPGWGR